MLYPYRSIDLYDHKYGVNTIAHGYLLKFQPWYYDGKAVWWGKKYELRSEAEKEAEELREKISEYKILRGSEKNSVRPEGET